MDGERFKSAMADVSKEFENPTAVLTARDLTKEQRIRLLNQWETDLRLLLVASEENMPGTDPGKTGEKLSEVRKALHTLGAAAPTGDDGAPTKTGGA
ncbi:MAG: hypothetical protein IT561_16140 [Alphaproteobacteria bacterium]|nr:hypothetical protein [Alphaproteobacteria bacterium]